MPISKKGNAKECSNYCTIALISHASKVMLKNSPKPGFNSTQTMTFQMSKLLLEKPEKPEIKLPTSFGLLKKQESSRKTSTSAALTMLKPLTVSVLVCQSCLTLCNPMDYSPPGTSADGILKSRILEWVAIPYSRRSFQCRDRT